MDDLIVLAVLALLTIPVGLIILFVVVFRDRVRRKRERREDQKLIADLTARIYLLEQTGTRTAPPFEAPAPPSVVEPHLAEPAIPQLAPPPPPKPVPPSAPFRPTEIAAAWVKGNAPAPPHAPAPSVTVPPPPPQHGTPIFASVGPKKPAKSALDLEEIIGTNWLNKLGIVIVVMGLAYFIAYKLPTLSPIGKVLVGYALSAITLGGGIWLEKKDRYRILARAFIGGGWALLFFTTYALYHVPAAQVLESQLVDLILMLIVAAAMVWHTLRYRSQVVTGLAFMLAFLTVTISHSNVYSLAAGGILAAGLVVITSRLQWFELELAGIAASYLNHYLWLRPIIEPMLGARHRFDEFPASVFMLVLYWAIFRASYVIRRPTNANQERISTFAALLNPVLLMVLLKYQSFHPEWAFAGLLGLGAAETILGQLPVTRRRRTAVVVLSTLGVTLLVAAIPFKYSGTDLTALWLLEAEALVLIGVWTREIVFRRLGFLAGLLVAGQMLVIDIAGIYERRSVTDHVIPELRLALIFAVAAALFYGNAHWVSQRWKDLFSRKFDRQLSLATSYVAGLMAFLAVWLAFPELWTAVAWCLLASGLAWAGRRYSIAELRYHAHLINATAGIRLFFVNFDATQKLGPLTLRFITVAISAAFLYATARWNVTAVERTDTSSFHRRIADASAWAATMLLAVLAWYELQPVAVAVAWAVGALVLLELGVARKSVSWRLQAYIVSVAAFLRIFVMNLNAGEGSISPRLYTVVPIALTFFYAYWRLRDSESLLSNAEKKIRAVGWYCWLGSIAIVALLRFEIQPDWVATAWAALALSLISLAWVSGQRVFLHQALVLSLAVAFRTSFHNFYQRSYFPPNDFWQSRWVLVGSTVALLLLALPFLLKLRQPKTAGGGLFRRIFEYHPEQFFFFIAVGLLTVMLALEMRMGMVTLSWGLEGVAVFLLALWAGERSFRLTGLGLLLLCVAKILFHDIWQQQKGDRFLTLIVLGVALLLVSFLYTRYREAIRQYL